MEIAILGGGVAGLSSAIALKQKGFSVTVYERHTALSNIGAGIVCWPNATFVLDKLGVLTDIAKVSGSIQSMNRYTHTGQPIGSLDISELNRLMTYPSYSILRSDLMNILSFRAAKLKIDVFYDHQVTELTDLDSKVRVSFANGLSIQPDLIIGADGRMNSLARKYVNGENTPKYQGFINWVGIVELPYDAFSALSVFDFWGIGERFGIVPVSRNTAYWAGGARSENINKRDAEQYEAELHTIFKDWPEIITEVIDTTSLSDINKIYVHDHNPIDMWHKHNVLLLGDSAHSPLPTSGQGACQALEDAWHIANFLSENPDNLEDTFGRYTKLRQAKTSGIIMTGRQLASSIFNDDADYCESRNQASLDTNFKNVVNGMASGWSSGLPIG